MEAGQTERFLTKSCWAADTDAHLLNVTVGQFMARQAKTFPDRIALIDGVVEDQDRRRWTYAELYFYSERVARSLLRRFRPGERVAVWSPNSVEWIFLQHGASLAGLILVTVNPAYLESEVEHVLATSRAAGLFHVDSYRGSDHAEMARKVASRLPDLRERISFSDWETFVAESDSSLALPVTSPEDVIQVQFTSGTTGRPKGAQLHHLGVLNAARFSAQRADFQDGGVWATAMPLFHVGGSSGSQLGAYSRGGTFVLIPNFNAGDLLALIEAEKIAHLHAVPTMVRALLDHPDRKSRDLSSLRTIMSGGSPVPATMVREAREAFGCRFTITFGQTELCGVVCQTHVNDDDEIQATTIGQPAPLMEVKIADPETGEVKPLGEYGEIWARGYQVMHGYFDLPEGSQTAITDDGWLKTGDQAAMDERGYLRITGRLKDCIIRGGENIYPREIEDVLEAHPAVRQAVVVGYPDPQWGEIVAAVLKLEPTQDKPDPLDFFRYCRNELATYKSPVRWYYVDSYPVTSSNKVKKQELRDQLAQGVLEPEPFEKPSRDFSPEKDSPART